MGISHQFQRSPRPCRSRRTNFEIGLNLESKIAATVSSDELTLPRIWKYERKARDYMSLYCFIHNIDEKEKDTFEKIGNSSKRKDVIEQ
jgi:hypothetical protein